LARGGLEAEGEGGGRVVLGGGAVTGRWLVRRDGPEEGAGAVNGRWPVRRDGPEEGWPVRDGLDEGADVVTGRWPVMDELWEGVTGRWPVREVAPVTGRWTAVEGLEAYVVTSLETVGGGGGRPTEGALTDVVGWELARLTGRTELAEIGADTKPCSVSSLM